MAKSKRTQSLIQFALFGGILLFVNILANLFYTHLDLTEEKRYTLTKPTRQLLNGIDDRIYVQILLEGTFPAGFKRLQTSAKEMLDEFRSETGYLDYQFEDPNSGSPEEVKERQKNLIDQGIAPTKLKVVEQGQSTQQLIYPVAIFHMGNRSTTVNLLENETPSMNDEMVINNSVTLLEYKFANAIKKLRSKGRPIILFTRGHGELDELQTKDFERTLRQYYDTDRLTLDSVVRIDPSECSLLVVAKPRSSFSEQDKFKIDQYIMNGGETLWLIDRMNADLDSMNRYPRFVPTDYPLNIEDLLFKYGVRIQPDLVVDLECSKIPLRVGQLGTAPQLELFPWYYHPTVRPIGKHPIIKNLDRVELKFCSSIDTIRTKTPIKKTVLLNSSKYSRLQFSPVDVSFEIVKEQPDPAKFSKGAQIAGVLLEGSFASAYENRVSEEMMTGLKQMNMEFKPQSAPVRMIVISDGDVAANVIRDRDKKEWLPLGFNRYESITYANKDLLLNAVEYLADPAGVIEARTKDVKLRLLDKGRTNAEKPYWQALNILLPLFLLGIFGWLFLWVRKRKYASE
jgi:ABC-2 type transport system permease protein